MSHGAVVLELSFLSLSGFAIGVILLANGLRILWLELLLLFSPAADAGSPGSGRVKLSGQAKPSANYVDPIYQERCCYFDVVVRKLEGYGKYATWSDVYKKSSPGPFYLTDDSGEVLVYPQGAELFLNGELSVTTNMEEILKFLNRQPPEIQRFIDGLGLTTARLEITAHFLREAAPVVVYGVCGDKGAAAAAARKEESSWPGAMGDLKMDEMVNALKTQSLDVSVIAESYEKNPRSLGPIPAEQLRGSVAISKSGDEKMILSDRSSIRLGFLFAREAAALLCGGLILIAPSGYYLATHISDLAVGYHSLLETFKPEPSPFGTR